MVRCYTLMLCGVLGSGLIAMEGEQLGTTPHNIPENVALLSVASNSPLINKVTKKPIDDDPTVTRVNKNNQDAIKKFSGNDSTDKPADCTTAGVLSPSPSKQREAIDALRERRKLSKEGLQEALQQYQEDRDKEVKVKIDIFPDSEQS